MTAAWRREALATTKGYLRPAKDRVRRAGKRTAARGAVLRLKRHNRTSSDSVLGQAPVTVSMTSYGSRIDSVAWALESIALGAVRPQRLVLWLDESSRIDDPPESLQRLQARGLEILSTADYGPHKKYYPYVCSQPRHTRPLVTADDDIIYPRTWLSRLLETYRDRPDQVSCYRANVILLAGAGFAPFHSWPMCRTTTASFAHMATGVSGVLYPPALLDVLRSYGDGFRASCPLADDIWLHWVALQCGMPVGQVRAKPRHFMAVPGTQVTSLTAYNVHGGGNDQQLVAVYTPDDMEALRRAAARRAA